MLNKEALSLTIDTKYWLKFSIINLALVAALGTLMRYKIGFEFPYLSQKYIQEAHSHFAFIGWLSHTIYVLMLNFIQHQSPGLNFKKYKILLTANLVCGYGMILSFITQGYSYVSIFFLTGTVIIACIFAYYYIRDLNREGTYHPASPWFKAALWFNIVSAAGSFYLDYMMASRSFDEHWYLAAVYYYLHFQYNGFFIFSCMGLFYSRVHKVLPTFKIDNFIFILFFISVIPAYFLSTLWANLPMWLYIIVIIASFIQVYAWAQFLRKIKSSLPSLTGLSPFMKYLFIFAAAAFSIKVLLQLGSTIPALSTLAYSFRPIVIAYLHLVLLAIISVFLLAFVFTFKLIKENKLSILGLAMFVIGIFLNELVLAIQGIASFKYIPIPRANETLFIIGAELLLSMVILVVSQMRRDVVKG